MTYDRKFLLRALAYAAIGMALGIYMAASHNHVQHVTHAHVLLVGFAVSVIYGVVHKLWLGTGKQTLAKAQFFVHQGGAAALFLGLSALYGKLIPEPKVGPVLGIASIAVFTGLLLMFAMVIKQRRA